jgi:hypothetical protein
MRENLDYLMDYFGLPVGLPNAINQRGLERGRKLEIIVKKQT